MIKTIITLFDKPIPIYIKDKNARDIIVLNNIKDRILPEGFSCTMLSDGKTLGIFKPKEKEVMIDDVIYLYPQNK